MLQINMEVTMHCKNNRPSLSLRTNGFVQGVCYTARERRFPIVCERVYISLAASVRCLRVMSEPEITSTDYIQFPDHNGDGERDDPPSYNSFQRSRGLVGSTDVQTPLEELHRRLSVSTESDLSSIGDDYDIASIASSIDDKLTWRGRMQLILHSHAFHYTIIALVVLDALIVLIEFLLDIGAFGNIQCTGEDLLKRQEFCHYSPDFRNMCAPPALLVLQNISIQPRGAPLDRELCHCGFNAGKFVCLPETQSSGVNPAIVLHVFSLAILSIFMVEVLLKMIAFRLKYFTHRFEVFDGIIVVISWTLDVASIIEEEAFEVAALLIVLRLWRIIRIVNGSVLAAKARSDNHLKEAKKEARIIIHAYHKSQNKNTSVENENVRFRKLLEGTGIVVDPLPEKTQSKSQLTVPLSVSAREE